MLIFLIGFFSGLVFSFVFVYLDFIYLQKTNKSDEEIEVMVGEFKKGQEKEESKLKIEKGMTKEQVIALIGEPSSKSRDSSGETWRYERSFLDWDVYFFTGNFLCYFEQGGI